ncbi:hypothetical protein ACA29_23455 [Lederbergia galactosidilytica]|uniref:Uncharacterized protein n=1 Tax=Lederbergia galactosidilytica TaxID=217031 RepID=A0A0Q9XM65_9BACI|nr:hypothetical protein ACA29_23455 [Lederbergia galactosidilytica]
MRKILFFFISFFILLGAMFIWSLIDNYAQEFENKRSTARSNSLKMNEETERDGGANHRIFLLWFYRYAREI